MPPVPDNEGKNVRGSYVNIALIVALAVPACGPEADTDALAICRAAPAAHDSVVNLRSRIPLTTDFDVIAGLLTEVSNITEPLQDWSYVATDELNLPVRESARAALANTGMYADGTNPITGSELTDNLIDAEIHWARLDRSCARLESG